MTAEGPHVAPGDRSRQRLGRTARLDIPEGAEDEGPEGLTGAPGIHAQRTVEVLHDGQQGRQIIGRHARRRVVEGFLGLRHDQRHPAKIPDQVAGPVQKRGVGGDAERASREVGQRPVYIRERLDRMDGGDPCPEAPGGGEEIEASRAAHMDANIAGADAAAPADLFADGPDPVVARGDQDAAGEGGGVRACLDGQGAGKPRGTLQRRRINIGDGDDRVSRRLKEQAHGRAHLAQADDGNRNLFHGRSLRATKTKGLPSLRKATESTCTQMSDRSVSVRKGSKRCPSRITTAFGGQQK